MTKALLVALLLLAGMSCDKPSKPTEGVQMIDPKDLLYTLATICDPIPVLQPGVPSTPHLSLHEDDWRQIEFVAIAERDFIRLKLSELERFKQSHRLGLGFTSVLVRPEHPTPLVEVGLTAGHMPRLSEYPLAMGDGTVPGGFALTDGSDWFIYGQRAQEGSVLQLGVSPGHGRVPSESFLQALSTLAGSRMLLVDWHAGVIVETGSPEAMLAWASRFQ